MNLNILIYWPLLDVTVMLDGERNVMVNVSLNNVWMQRTTQRRIKLFDLSVAGSLLKEMHIPDVTSSADKT